MPTDPPFRQVRPRDERLARLESALEQSPAWVLPGSRCGWGELVVFLLVPTPVRLARLRAREQQRYGAEPGHARGVGSRPSPRR